VLTAENLKKLKANDISEEGKEEIVSALLSRALQHTFCRRFEEALADLNLWPEASLVKMMADFAGAIREDYPEIATRLRESPKNN